MNPAPVDPIQLRAPRLTDKLLTEDLPEAIETLLGELEYLDGAIKHATTTHPALLERFKTKKLRLERAIAYLRGKIDTERTRRTTGDHHD